MYEAIQTSLHRSSNISIKAPKPIQYSLHLVVFCELKAIETSKNMMTQVISSMTSSSCFHFLKAALTKALAAASGAFYS
jgi:hypothetical protein